MEIKNIFKKTDTVDNVISDFTSVLDRLEGIVQKQQDNVSRIETEINSLQIEQKKSKEEANRAENIAAKISALLS
ncbi:MAG: hypothetical protein M0R77_07895 [Gammaproteobacteria bacterium]|nr:hypothetical protein [Gammaproteobacteria bacterium]